MKQARQVGMKPVEHQLWEAPALFCVLVVLVGLEWFLRR